MKSLKVNINSRSLSRQTSTTFSEPLARFFLYAWHLDDDINERGYINPESWIIDDPKTCGFKKSSVVAKHFQSALNDLISYHDSIHGTNHPDRILWNRDIIECHLLSVIAFKKNHSLDANAFKTPIFQSAKHKS